MQTTLTIPMQQSLLDLLQTLGDPASVIPAAVRQYVVDRCLQRLEAAEARVQAYIHKYGSDFATFNMLVTTDEEYLRTLNLTHPLWESDAIEWAYRLEEVELWRTRLATALQNSLHLLVVA